MATVMLKPLRHPWLWLGLWLLAIAVVIGVCLVPGADLPPMPRNIDKIEHALAFFVLAASAVQLFNPGRALLGAAAGLVLLGVGIEFAQAAFTVDRSADPLDALADSIGVLLGLATAMTPWCDVLLRMQGRTTGASRS
ncbi:MAG: VanZ family protein [Pseudoxanthomonas sp.]